MSQLTYKLAWEDLKVLTQTFAIFSSWMRSYERDIEVSWGQIQSLGLSVGQCVVNILSLFRWPEQSAIEATFASQALWTKWLAKRWTDLLRMESGRCPKIEHFLVCDKVWCRNRFIDIDSIKLEHCSYGLNILLLRAVELFSIPALDIRASSVK